MQAITLTEAKRNLEHVIERVVIDAEPTIVVTETGYQVVFLPLDEYNAWQETHYLLDHPANAAHLRRSMAEAQAGQAEERDLLDV